MISLSFENNQLIKCSCYADTTRSWLVKEMDLTSWCTQFFTCFAKLQGIVSFQGSKKHWNISKYTHPQMVCLHDNEIFKGTIK